MPRLTCIIPMYNSATTVMETIASVQAQTYADWEAIVVNDGSTDHGPALIEELVARDRRFRMVSQANRGLAGARNTGIEHCRTELIHFLDADDWMMPHGYEWLVGACGQTGASYGGYELCDDSGRSLGRQSPISAPTLGLDEFLEWNRAATHAHMFSREVIGDCRFDEQLRVVEDYDMWLRLANRGTRWQATERIVAGYRLRPNSLSKQFGPMCAIYEKVVRRAMAEARERGWEGTTDLSDRRLRRVVGNMALTYATMDALLDPSPAKGRAARLYDESAHPDYVTPAVAASTASVALPFGACAAPDIDGWSERTWLGALRQWWVRCAEEGWITFEQIDAVFAEFARKVVHPDLIVKAMLEAARGSQAVVVVGLERNGRRVVRHAAERGLCVLAIDNFSDEREGMLIDAQERAAWGSRVVFRREATDADRSMMSDAAWLVGPMEGGALEGAEAMVARLAPPGAKVIGWATERNRLGAANLVNIRACLDQRRAKAG